MKRFSLISIVLLFSFFMPQKKSRVVFFGDSITELGVRPGGYVRRIDSLCNLENKSNQFEFIGAGISGNKVYDLTTSYTPVTVSGVQPSTTNNPIADFKDTLNNLTDIA